VRPQQFVALVSMCVFVSPHMVDAQGSGDVILDNAYNSLAAGDYAGAAVQGRAYQSSYPRRFDADFIVAVGDCMAPTSTTNGLAELQALINAYVLDTPTVNSIRYWMGNCRSTPPPPPPESASSGVGISVSGLTGKPPPPPPEQIQRPKSQPRPLPPMSALIADTSFSGDDYWHMQSPSPASCAQSCRFESMCRSMTYIIKAQICYLKRSVPPAQHGSDFVSAFKRAE
jgi:PAN domain